MFYRNSYINKPRSWIWSDKSNASSILNAEFFGVTAPTTVFGKIKVAWTFVSVIDRKIKVAWTFISAIWFKVKSSGTFIDLV